MADPTPEMAPEYLLPQSVLPRAAAYFIDSLVVAVLTMILASLGVLKGFDLKSFDQAGIRELMQSTSGITLTIVLFAYFLILEGALARTPGKMALGMRVVRAQDGSPCGWARSLVRNCIRPFDLLFFGMPGAMVVMMTPARQRLGDLAGGTLVVRPLKVPAEMAAVIPGLLRRCPQCGRLAGASAACPGCAAPPPVTPEAARRQFGAAVMQPFAGMMAAGEAAAGLRAAAQAVLAAETAYAEASAAETARMERGQTAEEANVSGGAARAPVAATADDVSLAEEAVPSQATSDTGPFVHTDDAPHLSDDYVAAWRDLMQAVETLRVRRADLDAKLALARVPLTQLLASDPLLRGLVDQVEPYLDADDDEAVLAAYMARTSAGEEADS